MCFLGRRQSVVTAKFGHKKGEKLEFVQDSWKKVPKFSPSGDLIDFYTDLYPQNSSKFGRNSNLMRGACSSKLVPFFRLGWKSERGKGKWVRCLSVSLSRTWCPPWNEGRFLLCPDSGKDQWLETLKSRGWLVRAHPEHRVRTFHPIHRNVLLDPKLLSGIGVTIAFAGAGNKSIVKDD